MKNFIRQFLKRLLHPLVIRLGYSEKVMQEEENLLENFYSLLCKLNFKPVHIADIGANHGNWTRTALHYFPDATYTLLEPQEWLKASVNDLLSKNNKISFHAVGAGSKEGSFKFTVVGRDDSSSFRFSEMDAKKYGLKQIDIPVVTLNEFLPTLHTPVPDIIKIDAEGLDIEVLKGADTFFGKTEIFLVEAAVNQKDVDNSFLNVINYMDVNGYRLFEITDLNRPFKEPVLWLTELVFIRKGGFVDTRSIVSEEEIGAAV